MLDVVLEERETSPITNNYGVSILVVLDVVLEDSDWNNISNNIGSFNPCCAGCSSGSACCLINFA